MTHSTERISKRNDSLDWGNAHTRCMLHFCYLLMFWCLLRYDEALSLEFHQVQLRTDSIGILYLEVQLPFRKTHQTGDIAPFFLYRDDNAYLCPIRAYLKWSALLLGLGETLRGPVFRKPYAGGVFAKDNALKPGQFLDLFRHNLLDIGLDPRPYGTHSFRRGGAQYLHLERRWSVPQVCEWGGWSKDLDAQCTVFKYLVSWNDTSHTTRRQMLHPHPPLKDSCLSCKRNCNCH